MADIELFVEVGELPAGVFEEESSVESERRREHIRKQETTVGEMYAEYALQITTLKGMKNLSSPIRKKPMASITAIVISRALAIMSFSSLKYA